MCNLFSGAFKDNPYLAYGFLTGILRVAKESIFSGLNNLKVNSVLDDKYSKYFGFTKDEIKEMMSYYDKTDKYDETVQQLRQLMQGQTISSYVDTSVIYPEIQSNPTTIYSFLLAAGYLKTVQKEELYDGNSICEISIPNKEIFYVYEREILSALSDVISQPTAIAIKQAIISQNIPKLQEHLQKLLINTISFFDYTHENFYHGLILGICAVMNNLYHVDSNKESGYGRYDIQLCPVHNKKLPGIIIELKVIKEDVPDNKIEAELEKAADDALNQIDKKQYVTAMKRECITEFIKIGISFHKKQIRLKSNKE